MHIERSFAHILDCGGMRRTTLRGWENLNKRFKLAAAFYNLSQLMRKLFGFGTPKQLAAALKRAGRDLFWRLAAVTILLKAIINGLTSTWQLAWPEFSLSLQVHPNMTSPERGVSSTGC
jgi:hypothetical protein